MASRGRHRVGAPEVSSGSFTVQPAANRVKQASRSPMRSRTISAKKRRSTRWLAMDPPHVAGSDQTMPGIGIPLNGHQPHGPSARRMPHSFAAHPAAGRRRWAPSAPGMAIRSVGIVKRASRTSVSIRYDTTCICSSCALGSQRGDHNSSEHGRIPVVPPAGSRWAFKLAVE